MPPLPLVLSLAMFALGWHLAWQVRSWFARQDKRRFDADFAFATSELRKARAELAAERSLRTEPGCGGPTDPAPRVAPPWGTTEPLDPTEEYVEVQTYGGETFRIPLGSPRESIAKVVVRQNELLAVEHQRAEALRRQVEALKRDRADIALAEGRKDKFGSFEGDYRFTDQWLRDEPDGRSVYRNTASLRSPRDFHYGLRRPSLYVDHSGLMSPTSLNVDAMTHIISWCDRHDRVVVSAPQQDVQGVWVFETRDLTP